MHLLDPLVYEREIQFASIWSPISNIRNGNGNKVHIQLVQTQNTKSETTNITDGAEEVKKRLQYLHPKPSPGLVPYRLFYRVGIACRKMVY